MNSKHLKLPLILILFLLSLSLGQAALAVGTDDACTKDPPTGYGGQCNDTGPSYNAWIAQHPTLECVTGKCLAPDHTDPKWKCCRKKTVSACIAPNACLSQDACPGPQNRTTNTCVKLNTDSPNLVCCKPKCTNCADSKTGCPANWTKATDVNKYQSCGTGKFCCESGTGTGPSGSTILDIGQSGLSPIGNPDLPTLIGYIVKGALGVIGSIALLMFVYGGFIMLISQGDATKITKGKTAMVWAAIGIICIFGSYIFISYIIAGISQGGGGGGTTTSDGKTCGQGTYAGYSCRDKSTGKNCVTGLCPGGKDNQCCKPK